MAPTVEVPPPVELSFVSDKSESLDVLNPLDVNESEILEKITQTTLDFVKINLDPEKTLVIRLVHSFKLVTNKTS
mgnify:CR=1 FL=1